MIFNIRNIFNSTNAEGALAQNGATQYYIAPYQRGYKWGATSPNDPVCLLMKDILDASENKSSEYYLQFITTKISEVNNQKVLEVIDGQQRLTTLTILLSVLAYRKQDNILATSNDLLSYEVRPKVTEFFKLHIYQNIEVILKTSWTDTACDFSQALNAFIPAAVLSNRCVSIGCFIWFITRSNVTSNHSLDTSMPR